MSDQLGKARALYEIITNAPYTKVKYDYVPKKIIEKKRKAQPFHNSQYKRGRILSEY